MASDDDQQFCLRWNNFQANITSQFEALRDDEDFTDVTIACDGQKLHAHKVVLSACSPFFKELFKGNPCHHPIIFMRDVEAQHIAALIEFMYAGEVNIAQAHLSTFLKTAESLKIRGLTDTSTGLVPQDLHEDKCETEEVYKHRLECTSQDEQDKEEPPSISSPLSKRQCRSESDLTDNAQIEDVGLCKRQFKMELPDYLSDGDGKDDSRQTDKIFYGPTELSGAMEIIPHTSGYSSKGETTAGHPESAATWTQHQHHPTHHHQTRRLHSLDPRPCSECGKVYSNLSNLRQHMRLIHFPTYVRCHLCQKSFKTDLYLRRHIVSAHSTAGHALWGRPNGVGVAASLDLGGAFLQKHVAVKFDRPAVYGAARK